MKDLIVLRQFRETDRACIVETWWRSLKDKPSFLSRVPNGIMKKHMAPIINSVLDKASTIIAAYEEDPDLIVGYIVVEPMLPVLHYLYVKGKFQDLGIGKQLLDTYTNSFEKDDIIIISNITNNFVKKFMPDSTSKKKFIYNPFVIKELGYEDQITKAWDGGQSRAS